MNTRELDEAFPELPYDAWKDTCETLHMYTQVVGKIRLALSPMMNEWWQVPLYVTARGLTTSPIPYGLRTFQIDFDLLEHQLVVATNEGHVRTLPLHPEPVMQFHARLMRTLEDLHFHVRIWPMPVEVEYPIPFEQDTTHASYDPMWVRRFFQTLVQADMALKEFRAGFSGKASPVHFFWGTFDLAVSLYSGRPATPPPNADRIARVSFDAEQFECGYWPGNAKIPYAAFFGFAYPPPQGVAQQPLQPEGARFDENAGLFLYRYDDARRTADPQASITAFFRSAYEATARLSSWDRETLERPAPL